MALRLRAGYSDVALSEQEPGAVSPIAPVSDRHVGGSATDKPDPRRNPVAASVATPDVLQGFHNARGFRAPSNGHEPTWPQEGMTEENAPAGSFASGGANYGESTGVASDNIGDPESHYGYHRRPGQISASMGVGPQPFPGLGVQQDTEAISHLADYTQGRVDPRRYSFDGYPLNFGESEPVPYVNVDQPALPVITDVADDMIQKPKAWFLGGRAATRPMALFFRPFDQRHAARLTGLKGMPQSPPTFIAGGGGATPHASVPINTAAGDEAAQSSTSSPPGGGGTPGMAPVGPQRNTWRLQPQPWDAHLVNPGP